MKNLLLLIIAFMLISCGQKSNEFTLSGNIEGLQQGDTLFLSTYSIPEWKEEHVDTIIVKQADEFSFKKEIPYTTFFLFSHVPVNIPPVATHSLGSTLLIAPGDKVQLKGSIHYIAALEKSGGFYQDSLISRHSNMENALNVEQINAYQDIVKAEETKQKDTIQKYWAIYSAINSPKELEDLEKYIAEEVQDNEYSAYLYLKKFSGITATQLEEQLAKYTPEVKTSYMGKRLADMLATLKNIEVGNTPSDFTVVDMDNNKRSLADYRGKYLLIYYWEAFCPGTTWVQLRLPDLYERFHEKGFEVLGFTPYNFFTKHTDLKEDEEYQMLFNHPWANVLTDAPENSFMKKEFYFFGTPILMLVSPDGTTLIRGYSEINKVKKILEENLQ